MKAREKSGRAIDWAALRARLNESFEPAANASAIAERTLKERAARVALPLESERRTDVALQVLCFQRASQRYAIEARFVVELLKCGKLSRVPRAQPALVGVTNLRGDVLPVFDLALLEAGASKPAAAPELVVLGLAEPDLALLADSECDVIELLPSELTEPRALGALPHARFVRGVAADARLLLDGEAVLRDRKIFVARPGSSEPLERD